MRVSVKKSDPGYTPLIRRVGPESITLDGVPMREVITADATEGFVELYRRDAAGRCYLVDAEWATEIRRGRVAISLLPEA